METRADGGGIAIASISDILLAQGRQAAESKRTRAGTWIPLVQHLANLPGQVMADRAAEGMAQEAAFDRAQQRDVRSQQLAKGDQELAAGERATAQAEATDAQKRQMNELLATPGIIGEDGRFDTPSAQRMATEKGYRDIQDDLLKFGQEWNEGVEKGLLTKEQIESAKRANQPQGFALSPGQKRFDANGQEIASMPAEVKPDTRALNLQLKDALGRGDKAEANAIRQAIREAAEAAKLPSDASADVTALTPQGLDMAALRYKTTGIMPALGMGDKTTRQRIINRSAELTPDDEARINAGGGNIAANQANFRADSGSLAAMQKQRDAITSFEQTAQKNIDIFLGQAGKVVDTGSPIANMPLRAITGKVLGSPDQAAYDAARLVAINEIAKITSNPNMSGVLSDSARHEVEQFNPRSATLKQTVAVMRLLKRDMENRTKALDDTLAATRKRLSGATDTNTADPLGIRAN